MESSREHLEKVKEAIATGRPYALVFLNYRMPPGWNGFETLREVRKVAPELRKPFDQASLHHLAMKVSAPGSLSAPQATAPEAWASTSSSRHRDVHSLQGLYSRREGLWTPDHFDGTPASGSAEDGSALASEFVDEA